MSDGVRRVESEHWTLRARGASIEGEYQRRATLISLDGTPFECNQHVTYELVTTYQVSGAIDGDRIDLRETGFETLPSPCESHHRGLATYTGRLLTGGRLELRWKDGSQTLNRLGLPAGPMQARPLTARGSWVWQNRTARDADQRARVELEQWVLAESDGELSGTYLRTVSVYDQSGAPFECSGQPHYQYRDRYTVRGARDGARVLLSEISVDPEPHGCNTSDDRVLDTARGEIVGEHIVLIWRGRNRQILRAAPSAP